MKYENLFSPLRVNGMMLRNRIVAAPMGIIASHKIPSSTNYGGMSAYDRSLGGAAMVHICAEGPDPFAKYELDTTKEQINVAKQDGAKVSAEIGFFDMVPHDGYCWGPSDGIRFDKVPLKAFTKETMKQHTDSIITMCLNAKKAGFDAITLHMGHDSLLSQFLSPVWNTRTDEYGKDKGLYPREFLIALRKAMGKDFPIIIRVSRKLMVPESYEEQDMIDFLKTVEDVADMVNISCGMDVYYDANVHAVPTIFEPHMYNAEFAKKVKQQTKLKVLLVGAVMSPEEGDRLIKEGYTDAIMYGRSLIADPYWPKKCMEGKYDDIVPCIRCMQCYHIASNHWNVQCSVNPRFRREDRMALNQGLRTVKKKVVVVGGGVAGMAAALSAIDNGHEVTLIEKENRLGGLLYWAAQGPYKTDLNNYQNYLINKVTHSNIKVMMNTLATKELIKSLNPDRLIIAIGSLSRTLPIEGSDKMMDCLDAIEHKDQIGKNVVIIGGGSIGCELGLELAELNHQVTIIEMTNDIASNGNFLYRIALNQHIKKQNNLKFGLNTSCRKIKEKEVIVMQNQKEVKIPYDTVINATGRIPNREVAFDLYGVCPDTIMVGDCERSGSVVDAVNIAYFVGRSL